MVKVSQIESRSDMRPPCSALASIGSTISLKRRARTARAARPSSNPPIKGTNNNPDPRNADAFAEIMIGGNAEIIDMEPGHAFAQQIHHCADEHAQGGAKHDLPRFGVAQVALDRHEDGAGTPEPKLDALAMVDRGRLGRAAGRQTGLRFSRPVLH